MVIAIAFKFSRNRAGKTIQYVFFSLDSLTNVIKIYRPAGG